MKTTMTVIAGMGAMIEAGGSRSITLNQKYTSWKLKKENIYNPFSDLIKMNSNYSIFQA